MISATVALAASVNARLTVEAIPNLSLDDTKHRDNFEVFKERYGKAYSSREEHEMRFAIFEKNQIQAAIDTAQAEGDLVFGMTKFSDLTTEEFKMRYLNYEPQERGFMNNAPTEVPSGTDPPENVDWRTKLNVVTPVKNQGQCGSCWAFSATEAIESAIVLAGHSQEILSPQQIISCDKQDLGCNGGDTVTAYKYVEKAGGMALESDYPGHSWKTGKTGKCEKNFKISSPKLTGYSWATKECARGSCSHQNEDLMAENIAETGPASICVNAEKWQSYVSGVMTASHCGSHSATALDHCVQVVGYSNYSEEGKKDSYWIVRNSWATDWGIKGYIHLEMGGNTCGVANEATFAKVQ
jgi:C1A family cysteine protease